MSAYNGDFPVGSLVRVASRRVLERFKDEWKFHHPLQSEQLEFAGVEAEVVSVGYYHGGDVLCWLQDVPGVWHERCLEPGMPAAEPSDFGTQKLTTDDLRPATDN